MKKITRIILLLAFIPIITLCIAREEKDPLEDRILKNRFASDHPDPKIAGAVINTRLRYKNEKLWLVNGDIGTSFGIRFLASYYDHHFTN